MRLSPLLALMGLVVVGCTSTPPPQLEPYPGIGKQIINYYDSQSVSDNILCNTTQIQTLGDMKVLSDTPQQLVVSSSISTGLRTMTSSTADARARARAPSRSTRPAAR